MSSEDCAVRRGFSFAFWKKKKKKPNQTHKTSDCVIEPLYSCYVKTINHGDRLIRTDKRNSNVDIDATLLTLIYLYILDEEFIVFAMLILYHHTYSC